MKYGLAVVAFIVVAFLAIVFVINRDPSPTTINQPRGPVRLVEYENKDAEVSWTVKGEVTAEEERNAIRIVVTPTERRLEILDGYVERIERTETYSNTEEAYQAFLQALHRAGFTNSRKSPITDYRGVCPFGNRYVYDLSEDGESVLNLWSTSCRDGEGTFDGKPSTVRRLFQMQIIDYNDQVRDIDI